MAPESPSGIARLQGINRLNTARCSSVDIDLVQAIAGQETTKHATKPCASLISAVTLSLHGHGHSHSVRIKTVATNPSSVSPSQSYASSVTSRTVLPLTQFPDAGSKCLITLAGLPTTTLNCGTL